VAYIRKVKTASGAIAVQIAYSAYGKVIKIEHVGSAHNETELAMLLEIAQKLKTKQLSLLDPAAAELDIVIERSVSSVLLETLANHYEMLGFNEIDDPVFADLVIARLVEPTSKVDSIRVLAELGATGLNNTAIHRCLRRVISKDYRDKLAKLCFARASRFGDLTLVLYDVTTLYFEVQQEDDYRRPGLSKERRLEPQIVVGLLVDRNGFPLELHSFEGDKAETKTILPVMEAFRKRHGISNLTVVADAGMLSQTNLAELSRAGYGYIVGSRLHKIPYDISQYQKKDNLRDGQIFTVKAKVEGQKVIYQYREKRAALDRRNIAKQIAKAENIVKGKAPVKRSKFVKLSATSSSRSLNTELIDKALSLVGIKGYVTNLNIPAKQVIAAYHELWHVEQSFRMSKSDLKARPIFHHKQEAIEAHLTVVMAALALQRNIEAVSGVSLKQLVKVLRPIHSGIVSIEGKEHKAKPRITLEAQELLNRLNSAH